MTDCDSPVNACQSTGPPTLRTGLSCALDCEGKESHCTWTNSTSGFRVYQTFIIFFFGSISLCLALRNHSPLAFSEVWRLPPLPMSTGTHTALLTVHFLVTLLLHCFSASQSQSSQLKGLVGQDPILCLTCSGDHLRDVFVMVCVMEDCCLHTHSSSHTLVQRLPSVPQWQFPQEQRQ